jgi:hypothetical protein
MSMEDKEIYTYCLAKAKEAVEGEDFDNMPQPHDFALMHAHEAIGFLKMEIVALRAALVTACGVTDGNN